MSVWSHRSAIPIVSLLAAFMLDVSTARAEDYPARPVKIIVQSAAGGAPDVTARIVAEYLGAAWRQQVLVLNHPGAGGGIAARIAASAPADGYTLYMPAASAYVILPITQPNLPFDMQRAFVPIGFVGEQPMVIAASPALGVQTLNGLIALGKRGSSEILYAANNRGSLPHLTGELLRNRAGLAATFVPYPGPSQALHDIAGGRVSMIVEGLSGISGAISSGLLMPLGVASAARLPDFPHLPTVAESLPQFEATGWFALVAPAGTPSNIVQKIAGELRNVLQNPEVEQKFRTLGTYVRPMSPEQLQNYIHTEQEKWRPVVQQLGPQQPQQ